MGSGLPSVEAPSDEVFLLAAGRVLVADNYVVIGWLTGLYFSSNELQILCSAKPRKSFRLIKSQTSGREFLYIRSN